MVRRFVVLPGLGIDGGEILLSAWLVDLGGRVEAGEPVVEVLAGAATVDLAAPGDGVLVEMLAAEDEVVQVGQRLGVVETAAAGDQR